MFIQNKELDLNHNNLFASSKISIIVSDWNNEITELSAKLTVDGNKLKIEI